MACRLVAWAPSHYLNQCQHIINWTLRNIFKWNYIWHSKVFIRENVFKNVFCKIAVILFRQQYGDNVLYCRTTHLHLHGNGPPLWLSSVSDPPSWQDIPVFPDTQLASQLPVTPLHGSKQLHILLHPGPQKSLGHSARCLISSCIFYHHTIANKVHTRKRTSDNKQW